MANEPRRHHVVSAFHLAEFTDNRSRYGRLFVFDKNLRKTWPSTPDRVAWLKDFNKVDVDGVDPMGVEKGFGKFEGVVAPILRAVVDNRKLPTGDDFDVLVSYAAFATLRVPRFRQILSGFVDGLAKQLFRMSLSEEGGAKRARRLLEEEGKPVSDAEVEALQAVVASDDTTFDYEQTFHIQEMLKGIETVTRIYMMRHWALWTCDDGTPDVICSDSPVAFMGNIHWMMSPFTAPETTLLLPLSPRVVLTSRMEEIGATPFIMDEETVGIVNTFVADQANQVYSNTDDWACMLATDDGNRISNWQSYLDTLAELARESS
jgi:hypothetical protein